MTWWSNTLVQTVLVATSWPVTNTCPDPCDYRQPRCYDAKLTSLFVQTVLAAATPWPVTNTCLTFVITWCSNSLVQTVLAATSWHDKSQTPALTLVITDSQHVMMQNSPVYLYRLCWRRPHHDKSQTPAWPLGLQAWCGRQHSLYKMLWCKTHKAGDDCDWTSMMSWHETGTNCLKKNRITQLMCHRAAKKYLQRLKSYHICVFIVIYPWKPQWLV